jgi:stalled ribosome rescue protein Dom34
LVKGVSVKPKRRREKRGYPVAVLVGLEEEGAVLWRVFSKVAKYESTIQLEGPRNDAKALYNFHEALINALRPVLREGVRSVVLVSPAKSNYGKSFVSHVQLHHAWLAQGSGKAAFSEVNASAGTLPEVALLVKSASFHQILSETASEEAEMLVELLEKRLNVSGRESLVLYSLTEIEDLIYGPWKQGKPSPEYLLLTDAYVGGSRAKGRLQRLMQIAVNKGVKVKVVDFKSAVGARVAQFGGLVLLAASA